MEELVKRLEEAGVSPEHAQKAIACLKPTEIEHYVSISSEQFNMAVPSIMARIEKVVPKKISLSIKKKDSAPVDSGASSSGASMPAPSELSLNKPGSADSGLESSSKLVLNKPGSADSADLASSSKLSLNKPGSADSPSASSKLVLNKPVGGSSKLVLNKPVGGASSSSKLVLNKPVGGVSDTDKTILNIPKLTAPGAEAPSEGLAAPSLSGLSLKKPTAPEPAEELDIPAEVQSAGPPRPVDSPAPEATPEVFMPEIDETPAEPAAAKSGKSLPDKKVLIKAGAGILVLIFAGAFFFMGGEEEPRRKKVKKKPVVATSQVETVVDESKSDAAVASDAVEVVDADETGVVLEPAKVDFFVSKGEWVLHLGEKQYLGNSPIGKGLLAGANDALTIELWLQQMLPVNEKTVLVDILDETGEVSGSLFLDAKNRVNFSAFGQRELITFEKALIPDGSHFHIAATVDEGELSLYINGKLRKSLAHINGNGVLRNNFRLAPKEKGQLSKGLFLDEVLLSESVRYSEDFIPNRILQMSDDTLAYLPMEHYKEGVMAVYTPTSAPIEVELGDCSWHAAANDIFRTSIYIKSKMP